MQERDQEERNGQSMSTEAVEIYDSQGEKAMLAFVMRKERSAGPTGETEYGCYILEDGSAVCFERPGGEYRDSETGEVRPQALEPGAALRPPPRRCWSNPARGACWT